MPTTSERSAVQTAQVLQTMTAQAPAEIAAEHTGLDNADCRVAWPRPAGHAQRRPARCTR
jgi:hypothetical protein